MREIQKNRNSLENAILAAAKVVHEDDVYGRLDRRSVDDFLATWRELVTHYDRQNDTDIGVEVVREYLDWVTRFSTIWHSERRSSNCRDLAQDACYELEACMEDIIKAVDSRLYPSGR